MRSKILCALHFQENVYFVFRTGCLLKSPNLEVMLETQKVKSIFLQLFDISQQIAISSLQGYFSAAAAENIESQDGASFGIFKNLKFSCTF